MNYDLQSRNYSSSPAHIKKLPKNIQRKLIEIIELLAEKPRPVGVVKLSTTGNLYRVRTGDYRIIYEIQDRILLIVITKVGHRRDVYK